MKPVLKQLLFSRGIVKNGLVLWLEGEDFFNSPPTTNWGDRSGNRNNATPSGMAYTTSSGSDGVGGVVFDGVNDSASTNLQIDTSQDFTIETVVKRSIADIRMGIISQCVNAHYGIVLAFGKSNNIVIYQMNIATPSIGSGLISNNIYYHIIALNKNGALYLYVNGVQVANITTDIGSTTSKIKLGVFYTDTLTNVLNGKIKLTRAYNRALTDQEIRQNYNASR